MIPRLNMSVSVFSLLSGAISITLLGWLMKRHECAVVVTYLDISFLA